MTHFCRNNFTLKFCTTSNYLVSYWIFDAAPKEVEEQALVDGLSRFQAFRKVVIPQVAPGIGAAAVFGFVLSWNDLFYALILAPGNSATLPVKIASFNTFRGVELGAMCAAILVAVIPVLIVSFFIQNG